MPWSAVWPLLPLWTHVHHSPALHRSLWLLPVPSQAKVPSSVCSCFCRPWHGVSVVQASSCRLPLIIQRLIFLRLYLDFVIIASSHKFMWEISSGIYWFYLYNGFFFKAIAYWVFSIYQVLGSFSQQLISVKINLLSECGWAAFPTCLSCSPGILAAQTCHMFNKAHVWAAHMAKGDGKPAAITYGMLVIC